VDLSKLKKIFLEADCSKIVFKELADNDNSKNQFYIGGDFSAVSTIPFTNLRDERSGNIEHTKRTAKSIFKADIDFSWLDNNGQYYPAPAAQIIFYPQYPEVRLTGLLKGCQQAPSGLVRSRQSGRLLFLGICKDGKILGYITGPESPIATEIRNIAGLEQQGVFWQLPITVTQKKSKELLLSRLCTIYKKGWIAGQRLKGTGELIEYYAPNAGGYTLEAELGILPQGFAVPDYMGWEVKQHTVSNFSNINTGIITLLTPEPDSGFYKEKGVEAFIRQYGRPDQNGVTNRLNFGGLHYVNRQNLTTNLIMVLEGYDSSTNKIIETGGGICLVDGDNIAAKWSYTGIIEHWKRKHALAVYVPGLCRKQNYKRYYHFGPEVRLGEGTDVLLLLKAMLEGCIYYDPGIKLENIHTKPRLKRRSQFRIHSKNICMLYKTFSQIKACDFSKEA
jgi:hypothetical protein